MGLSLGMHLNQDAFESERGCFVQYMGHRDNSYKLRTISDKPGCLLILLNFSLK